MAVSIILVNYNGYMDTIACIESLTKQCTTIPYSIVVVDNHSPNNSFIHLLDYFKASSPLLFDYADKNIHQCYSFTHNESPVFLLKSKINGGFSYGNNQGIIFSNKHILPDFYWLLNNDTEVHQNCLEELISSYTKLSTDFSPGILGAKLLYFENRKIINSLGGVRSKPFQFSQIGRGEVDTGKYDTQHIEFDYVEGASMFVSKSFVEDVGLMYEDLFLYQEENEWISRAKNSSIDWTFHYVPKAEVYHKVGASIVKSSSDKNNRCSTAKFIAFYYGLRNSIYVYRTYKQFSDLKIAVYLILKISKTVVSMFIHNDSDKFKRLKIIWSAVIDGYNSKLGRKL